jgi:hypothetical protein
MRKRGQGAIYSCSSGKRTPRAVERTTWLGRGPTVAISRTFGELKTRWAGGVAASANGTGYFYIALAPQLPSFLLEGLGSSTFLEPPGRIPSFRRRVQPQRISGLLIRFDAEVFVPEVFRDRTPEGQDPSSPLALHITEVRCQLVLQLDR